MSVERLVYITRSTFADEVEKFFPQAEVFPVRSTHTYYRRNGGGQYHREETNSWEWLQGEKVVARWHKDFTLDICGLQGVGSLYLED